MKYEAQGSQFSHLNKTADTELFKTTMATNKHRIIYQTPKLELLCTVVLGWGYIQQRPCPRKQSYKILTLVLLNLDTINWH